MRGRTLDDRFALEAEAGSGGFGSVFRARDLRSGSPVAVKVLHDGSPDAAADARFAREARLLAELGHPGVVGYVAEGLLPGGRRYLVMEWLEGEDLRARLDRSPLAVAETVILVRGLADALAAVHGLGIVHRDLKPANVLLRGGDVARATLLDLGIARRSGLSVTRTGQVMGTPRYMAPEQAWGRVVTPAADVFALGCVAFECLAGVPPFFGEHAAAELAQVLFGEAPDLGTVRPDLPPAVVAAVRAMLLRDPEGRPADGAAVRELWTGLEGTSGEAPPPRPSPAFGREELRLATFVVAEAPSEALERALEEEEEGTLARVADGVLVATFLHEGPSADGGAVRAAGFAGRLRDRLPPGAGQVVVATGRTRDARTPEAEVLSRARTLASAGSGGLSFDEITISLLAGHGTGDASRPLLGVPTPCVGRDQELATLELAVESSAEEPAARAVLVVAEAGTGKSRLRHELVRRLAGRGRERLVLLGRADALRVGASYAVLASALSSLFPDEAALRARVARHFDGEDAARVTELLGVLVGLEVGESPRLRGARLDPRAMQAQLTQAWVDFLRAESRLAPVLLLLEDLHWSDGATLDLVEAALRELPDAALVVVAFARPEIAVRRPGLWRGRVQELPLRPLSRRACERLVREVLGASAHDDLVAAIASRSAGNALFLEELVRAAHAGQGETPPPTVLAMLQARLSQLPPSVRRVLRAASVLGEAFSARAVAAVVEAPDVEEELAELTRAEVVERRPEADLARFRHTLMRDAAYALLTEADRRVGHLAAGRFLASEGAPSAVVAEHFVEGGDVAAASPHILAALERAWVVSDAETWSRLARRALAVGVEGEARGAAYVALASHGIHTWEWRLALERAAEADAVLPPGSAWWCRGVTTSIAAYAYTEDGASARALAERHLATEPAADARMTYAEATLHVASAMIQIGAADLGRRGLERVDALAPDLAEVPSVRAFYCLIRNTWIRHTADLFGPQLTFGEEAIARYEALSHSPTYLVLARDVLGEVLCRAGQRRRGEEQLRQSLAAAPPLGQAYFLSHARVSAAHGLAVFEEPVADAEVESLARAVLATKGISSGYEAMARHLLAQVLGRRGERTPAIAEVDRAIALSEHTPVRRLQMLATRAELARDDVEARALVERALALLEEMGGEGGYAEAPAHAVAIAVLRRTGEAPRAARLAERARTRLLARQASLATEAERASFFAEVPLHRRILALAEEAPTS